MLGRGRREEGQLIQSGDKHRYAAPSGVCTIIGHENSSAYDRCSVGSPNTPHQEDVSSEQRPVVLHNSVLYGQNQVADAVYIFLVSV